MFSPYVGIVSPMNPPLFAGMTTGYSVVFEPPGLCDARVAPDPAVARMASLASATNSPQRPRPSHLPPPHSWNLARYVWCPPLEGTPSEDDRPGGGNAMLRRGNEGSYPAIARGIEGEDAAPHIASKIQRARGD